MYIMNTEQLLMINEILGTAFGAISLAYLAYLKYNQKHRFDRLDTKISNVEVWTIEELKSVNTKLSDISSNFSAEQKIMKIAVEAEQFVDANDNKLLQLIKTYVDVSIHFYNHLTSQPLSRNTCDDIARASNLAIQDVLRCTKELDKDFIDLFWDDFEKKAIDIRSEFLDIFTDKFNRKEDRFVMAIEKYLFDQLKTLILCRTKYLSNK